MELSLKIQKMNKRNELGSYFVSVVIDHLYFPLDHDFSLSELNLSAGAKRGSPVIRFENDDLVIFQVKISYFNCRGNFWLKIFR